MGSSDGMVYIASDNVQVLNSWVQYSADMGIIIEGSSPLIRSTQIRNNLGFIGGGLYIHAGHPTIQNNIFSDNTADRGGGLCLYSGHPTI